MDTADVPNCATELCSTQRCCAIIAPNAFAERGSLPLRLPTSPIKSCIMPRETKDCNPSREIAWHIHRSRFYILHTRATSSEDPFHYFPRKEFPRKIRLGTANRLRHTIFGEHCCNVYLPDRPTCTEIVPVHDKNIVAIHFDDEPAV